MGLNCFATLNTVLSNLGGSRDEIPDLKSMAATAAKIVDYYSKSICYDGNNFEALIYGYCHVSRRLERYYIQKVRNNEDIVYQSQAIENDEVFMLGDHKAEIAFEINEKMLAQDGKDSIEYWRTPLKVLSNIATSGKYETIGGGTQLNIADIFGCEPRQAVRERTKSDMRFRNIDLHSDIDFFVGKCIIAMPGLDYKIK